MGTDNSRELQTDCLAGELNTVHFSLYVTLPRSSHKSCPMLKYAPTYSRPAPPETVRSSSPVRKDRKWAVRSGEGAWREGLEPGGYTPGLRLLQCLINAVPGQVE